MTTWSMSPGRLTPDQAAGVSSTARLSARNASRQLPSRAPRTWTTGLDTRFASSSTSAWLVHRTSTRPLFLASSIARAT